MEQLKVLVIGYYHRKNLGDDVFEHVFINYFQKKWPKSVYNIVNIDAVSYTHLTLPTTPYV